MQALDHHRRTTIFSKHYQTIQVPLVFRDEQRWRRSNKP